MSYTEEELIGLLAENLDEHFPLIVSLFTGKLYHFARSNFRLIEMDAEDIVQEVMMNAYNALRGYSVERILCLKLNAWMYTIAENECIKLVNRRTKRQQNEIPLDELSAVVAQFTESPINTLENIQLFQQAFKELTPDEQKVVFLHFIDGMKYAEIGKMLGKEENTVKSHVLRARRKLNLVARKLLKS